MGCELTAAHSCPCPAWLQTVFLSTRKAAVCFCSSFLSFWPSTVKCPSHSFLASLRGLGQTRITRLAPALRPSLRPTLPEASLPSSVYPQASLLRLHYLWWQAFPQGGSMPATITNSEDGLPLSSIPVQQTALITLSGVRWWLLFSGSVMSNSFRPCGL